MNVDEVGGLGDSPATSRKAIPARHGCGSLGIQVVCGMNRGACSEGAFALR